MRILEVAGHTDKVNCLSFHPSGKLLVSASDDNTILSWNVTTGERLVTMIGHTDSVTSVSFNPKDNTLASSSLDNTIRFWDINPITFCIEGVYAFISLRMLDDRSPLAFRKLI